VTVRACRLPARLRRRQAIAALPLAVLAAMPLASCVAAVALPLVAGGGVAHKMLLPRASSPVAANRPAALSVTTASSRAAITAGHTPAVLARPGDVTQMRPGVLYAGALPPPADASPTPADTAPAAADTADTEGRKLWSWANVVPFVADRMLTAPAYGALLERGSSVADPRWMPCGDMPRAILVDLNTAAVAGPDKSWKIAGGAQRWLEALQTLNVRVIFTSAQPEQATGAIRAAFDKAGLGRLAFGDNSLRLGLSSASMPRERAAAAATYCVLAAVGRAPADFPNGLLPDTTPPALATTWGAGWFRLSEAH
jgi:hypothetical protein